VEFFKLHNNKDERCFVNRDEAIELVRNEFKNLCTSVQGDFFRVIEIYGMGGIGKSRFVRKLYMDIFNNDCEKVFVSFEIKKREQVLDNLIFIRKQLAQPMLRFDFALINYWDRNHAEKLDDSFMNKIKNGLIISLSDLASHIIGLGNYIPSLIQLTDILNALVKKHRHSKAEELLYTIGWSDQYLIEQMPVLLGSDLKEHIEKRKRPYVFIFDSYMQSQPYSESKEWLYQLIGATQKGLFIISGREKLRWSDKEEHILQCELENLPVQAAQELLEKNMLACHYDMIPMIINTTECIPIYMNLALDLYQGNSTKSDYNVDSALFSDKHLLVKNFICHLQENFHDAILALAVVRIFDENIFTHLNKELNLGFPVLEFETLCNITLINYIETSKGLLKFHDVFSSNAIRVHTSKQKEYIFRCYLQFISMRSMLYRTDELTTLFLNILETGLDIFKHTSIPNDVCEGILEVFFRLMSQKANFDIPSIPKIVSGHYKDTLLFVYAEIYRGLDTRKVIQWLEDIKNPKAFGRHEISYRLLLLYKRSLIGEYATLAQELKQINCDLKIEDIGTWYYLKTKHYLTDYFLMEGNFLEAYQMILNTRNECDNSLPINDDYLLRRTIGHIYRFNMQISDAKRVYQELVKDYGDISRIAVYLYTNLCESSCYFDDDVFESTVQIALRLSEQLTTARNTGKILYSQAIQSIIKKNYNFARECINKSININENDGYQSGKLFAFMAQAYLDYAQNGIIKNDTFNAIDELLIKNEVYTYFRLPIYIMQKQEDLVESQRIAYNWLNFDYTVHQYRCFIGRLNH